MIFYCLKDAINRRFLRKLVEGKVRVAAAAPRPLVLLAGRRL